MGSKGNLSCRAKLLRTVPVAHPQTKSLGSGQQPGGPVNVRLAVASVP